MKYLQAYAAAVMALLLIGCGGSDGKGGTTPVDNGNLGTPRIEAIVRVSRASLQHPDNFTNQELLDPTNQEVYNDLKVSAKTVFGLQDPLNFQIGENFIFQLVAYDQTTGERVILPATFASSDIVGAYGQLGENSGSFDASNTATADNQTMFANYNGHHYEVQFAVRPRQARVVGKILAAGTNAPIAGIQLLFYTNSGQFVGQVTSAADGTYRASVPTSAFEFTVEGNTIAPSNWREFTYNSLTFDASNPDCRATLPALQQGTQTLGSIYITPRTSAQPPLSGCSG